MSRTLLHDWEGSIERNKNNTEELLNIAEDIYNTAYTRGKASTERPQGEWQYTTHHARRYRICPFCKCEKEDDRSAGWFYCWHCGADMRKGGAE